MQVKPSDMKGNSKDAFFALVRAGLWADTSVHNSWFTSHGSEQVDWEKVYQLAEEQSVVGIVLAGIERLKNANYNLNLDQELLLQWIGEVQMLEQQNKDMNAFIGKLVEKMRDDGIYTVLVKGQGIAQCYERPLWRTSGDIDLLLSDSNFWQAKKFLDKESGMSCDIATNDIRRHLEYSIDSWIIELHGTLHTDLYGRLDRGVDKAQHCVFYGGEVRSWKDGNTAVFLPSPDNDVIFVFTHILQHFSQGGIGLRQICDLCRLLHTYKEEINQGRLHERLRKMRLENVWKTFGALAVDYLGMPPEEYPIYKASDAYKKKAGKVIDFVLEVGNMGYNRDTSYAQKYHFIVSKIISFFRETLDIIRHSFIFPEYAIRVWFRMVKNGVESVIFRN